MCTGGDLVASCHSQSFRQDWVCVVAPGRHDSDCGGCGATDGVQVVGRIILHCGQREELCAGPRADAQHDVWVTSIQPPHRVCLDAHSARPRGESPRIEGVRLRRQVRASTVGVTNRLQCGPFEGHISNKEGAVLHPCAWRFSAAVSWGGNSRAIVTKRVACNPSVCSACRCRVGIFSSFARALCAQCMEGKQRHCGSQAPALMTSADGTLRLRQGTRLHS